MSVPAADLPNGRPSTESGGIEIAAERFVNAAPEAVFAFLSDLENHWLLADRFVELVNLDLNSDVGDGGTIRLRGPLRLHRTATTRLVTLSPERLTGSAAIGRRTHATLRWVLRPDQGGTAVRLAAMVEALSLPDRLLLALGGRRWLRVRFAATIERLRQQMMLQSEVPPSLSGRPALLER